MASSRKVILSKPVDWETWISFVETKATRSEVWDLINPSFTIKPSEIPKPSKPVLPVPAQNQPLDKDLVEIFKLQTAAYRNDLDEYDRQQRALTDIINFIHESISVQTALHIRKVDSHPWSQLRALKAALAPTDQARSLEIEKQYHKLARGPGNRDLEAWLQDFEFCYADAKLLKLGEMEGQRAQRDFLLAVAPYERAFSDNYLLRMSCEAESFQMADLIEKFRHLVQLHQVAQTEKKSHQTASFAASTTSGSENSESAPPTFNGRGPAPSKMAPPACICGFKHWYQDCYYLRPEIRLAGWKPNSQTQAKVTEALKDDRKKAYIEGKITKAREFDARKASSNQQQNSSSSKIVAAASTFSESSESSAPDTATFAMGTFYANSNYSLRNSWILDNGSNDHVCNSTMKHRFTKTRKGTGELLAAGRDILEIECYGTIQITVDSPTGPKLITLTEVCYVPDLMTNAVSDYRLSLKGVFFDGWKKHLHVKGKTLYNLKHINGHYLLEDNTTSNEIQGGAFPISTGPLKSKKASTFQWHQMLAHASNESVQHLQSAAEGVEISDGGPVPRTNQCEPCALAKAREIISRRPDIAEVSNIPFHRISYDLIQMESALNKDSWISHVADYFTDFNMVYSHRSKSQASAILIQAINTIETRYSQKVAFIRSDGEKSLGDDFSDMLAEKGISFEPAAPDTQAQNGHSERKGGVLLVKARALRIDAGLPHYLWHEVIKTAAYIANRTPMRKHGWKTPYEMVTGKPPHLGHLHAYGCKAYPLNKHIPRKMKLQERAHLGYLVGYEARTIFRIWIPSQRKIIRTRDVLFDDDSIYDPHDIDVMQIINEPMLETTYDPINAKYYTHIQQDIELDEFDEEKEGEQGDKFGPQDTEDIRYESEGVDYLPTPQSSDFSTGRNTPTPSASSRASSHPRAGPAPNRAAGPASESSNQAHGQALAPPPPLPAPRMIGLDLDEANILPEGVGRRRAPRRQAYSASLINVQNGEISSFHAAFSALTSASKFLPTATSDSRTPITSSFRLHRDSLPPEPKNLRQLLRHPHASSFQAAITSEINSLRDKGTWEEIPTNKASPSNIIPTMWVFKYKFDEDGYLVKFKARLCARGDLQLTAMNTYAATLAARVFRSLMAIVAAYNLETRQYDAVNAFANSPIDEAVYCRPPEGWPGNADVFLLLHRALYGLKQSPALWYKHLFQALVDLGLEPLVEVECLFMSRNSHMLLFFFVDDIVVLYDHRYASEVDEFQTKLFERFEMRYIGELEWFLGIHISRDRTNHTLSLCQDSYVDKITSKFNVDLTAKGPSTPLPAMQLMKNHGQATPQEIHAYQQRVGSINFAAVITRADIAHAASKLSEFLTNPSKFHMECADRIIAYLGHTKRYSIHFNPHLDSSPSSVIFLGSSDASFADDPLTRYSSQGYGFMLFGGLIDWKASKQRTVTTSSTEAEFLAISAAGKELIWWTRFFESINFRTNQIPFIQCDNMQTIRALNAPNFTTKLRHIDIHRHWLRQEVSRGQIHIQWVSTSKILADGLTKALPLQRHADFIKLLGLKEVHVHGQENHEDRKISE